MKFVKRTLQSAPGLSQEDALISLQNSAGFKPGTRIASIRRSGPRWLVDLLEPKIGGPPPAFADEGPEESGPPEDGPPEPSPDEGPEPEGPDEPEEDAGPPSGDDSGESGPPKPKGEGKKPGKGGTEEAILHTLQQILHALSGEGPDGMGGPDALGPGPGSPATPPPPHGGPPGGPLGGPPKGPGAGPAGGAGAKLRPGETRNTPGTVPVGAPAFSSTKESILPPTGMPAAPGGGAMPPAVPPVPSASPGVGPTPGPTGAQGQPGTCPQCGYPEPCPLHGGGAGAPMSGPVAAVTAQVQKFAGRSRHISLSAPGNMKINDAIKVARQAAQPFGYSVQKAKRVNDKIIILASAN